MRWCVHDAVALERLSRTQAHLVVGQDGERLASQHVVVPDARTRQQRLADRETKAKQP